MSGEIKRTCGSRAYPAGYGYDPQSRLTTMTNWTTFASAGERVTTWNYSTTRGWPNNKRYPDSTGPDYIYTFGGRLKTRTWARTGAGGQRIVTTYTYGFDDGSGVNDHADLVSVAYSNDPTLTPSVTYVYDRRGRQQTVTRSGITTTLSYNDANKLLSESYSGGTLSGLSVQQGYDTLLRRTSVAAKQGAAILASATYAYESTSSRLQSVGDGVNSATYSYLVNSPLISQIAFKQNTTVRMTTTKQPDYLNRLTSITSTPSRTGILPVTGVWTFCERRAGSNGLHWIKRRPLSPWFGRWEPPPPWGI